MKILVTGASGMLACAVIDELEQAGAGVFGEPINVIKGDVSQRVRDIKFLDICNLSDCETLAAQERPDYIFHLAAETNVDYCETNSDHAYKVNYIGTENIALVCQKYEIPLLYVSTGSVFSGGKKEPYTEFDDPNPINVYAKSKLLGEIAVQRLLKRYFIVRAGWMVGGWEIDKKFVYKIITQLQEGKRDLLVVNDKFGSPTFTVDFARNLLPLIKSQRYGLYHMANLGGGSRYDISLRIVDFMGLFGKVNVRPISSDEFPLPAPRPRSEMLRNYHLELIGINNMPLWEESLRSYVVNNIDK